MLKERLIEGAAGSNLATDRSRCLRMRFNRHSCSLCLGQCRANAIEIDDDVRVRRGSCSACMLCVSACPSDCFQIRGLDYYRLIGRLSNLPPDILSPVLGCDRSKSGSCHARTFCFGFLSEEHLMALFTFLERPVQIDASGCAECVNSFIVEVLERRILDVEAKTSMQISERVILVKNRKALDFREIPCDRRGFFKALRNSAVARASVFFENDGAVDEAKSYSAKRLPFKRELLNGMVKTLPEKLRVPLMRSSYYSLNISDTCSDCFSCVAICPTGALKPGNDAPGARLLFNPSTCNGCGLCKDFCPNSSITLLHGYSGQGFWRHEAPRMTPQTVHEAGGHGRANNAGIV